MHDPLLDCEDDIREHLAEHITQQCPPLLGQQWNMRSFRVVLGFGRSSVWPLPLP